MLPLWDLLGVGLGFGSAIIGKKATIGAGSSLTKNVKDKALALTRANQIEIKNYKRK